MKTSELNSTSRVDISELNRRIAVICLEIPIIESLREAIRRDIFGMDVTSEHEETISFLRDAERVGTAVQLLYIEALARSRGADAALLATKFDKAREMDLLDEHEPSRTQGA